MSGRDQDGWPLLSQKIDKLAGELAELRLVVESKEKNLADCMSAAEGFTS